MILPVHVMLNRDEISIQEAAASFSAVMANHLRSHNQLKVHTDSALKVNHCERSLLRTKLKLAVQKNRLRRSIKSSPRHFLQAVRAHNRLCKSTRAEDMSRKMKKQEKAFRSNPWKFAKSACTSGEPQLEPLFSMEDGLKHFQDSFNAVDPPYFCLRPWCTDFMQFSSTAQDVPHHPFDLSPITPSLVN